MLLRLLLLEWDFPVPRGVVEPPPGPTLGPSLAAATEAALPIVLLNQGTRPLGVAAERHSGCSSAAVRILGPVRRR